MDMLKERVYKLYNKDYKLSIENYTKLMSDCVYKNEMAAVVFIYDHIKDNGITPSNEIYNLIDKLHSKTVKESNEIYIKNQDLGKLKPRRRIHKIMKGYNYSDNYNKAIIHLDKVKKYIEVNTNVKDYSRIKLAKNISKNCSISFNDIKYIITNLKRTKFLVKTPKKDDFSKISTIHKNSKTNTAKYNE